VFFVGRSLPGRCILRLGQETAQPVTEKQKAKVRGEEARKTVW
jgi:hypothetical protein